jgi:hypothetical protein
MNAADYAITLAKNSSNEAEILVINVIDLPPIFKMLLLTQESSLS